MKAEIIADEFVPNQEMASGVVAMTSPYVNAACNSELNEIHSR